MDILTPIDLNLVFLIIDPRIETHSALIERFNKTAGIYNVKIEESRLTMQYSSSSFRGHWEDKYWRKNELDILNY